VYLFVVTSSSKFLRNRGNNVRWEVRRHCPKIVVTVIDHPLTNITELFTPRRERSEFFQRLKQNPKKLTVM